MALHALQDVDDALETTRELLTPIALRQWVKLAVVALIVGGGVSVPAPGFDASTPAGEAPDVEVPASLPADFAVLVAAAVAVVALVGLVWTLVGSIMEFVLVESLRSGDVRLREYWRARWRQGLRLLGFRIAVGLPVLALVLGWLALVVGPLLVGFDPAVPVVAFLLGLPLLFAVTVLVALVYGFTTVFVVAIMIVEDCGVLAGWRRLWPSLVAEWKQYLAYAVASVVLTFALGVLTSILLAVAAFVLLLPLGGVGLLLYATVPLSSTAGLVGLGSLVAVFLAAMVALWALVRVPVVVFLRYYALLVLGDVDGSLDPIPDRRAAVRAGE